MKTAPPPGAWLTEQTDGFELGATTSQSVLLLGHVAFGLLWLCMMINMIYGEQIRRAQFDPVASVFGLLFVAGGIGFISSALMGAVGKVWISVRSGHATIFSGVGSVGFRSRFRWSEIASIRPAPTRRGQGGLFLLGRDGRRVAVIRGLKRDRLDFVANELYGHLSNARVAPGGLYR